MNQKNSNNNKSSHSCHISMTIRALMILLIVLLLLVDTTIANNGYGSSGGGNSNSFSSGGTSSYGFGGTSTATSSSSSSSSSSFGSSSSARSPVRSYGGGYASSTTNSRWNRYPNQGYNKNLLYGVGGFYLGSSYRRNSRYNNNNNVNNNDNNNDENYKEYFDRIENGCQLTGVESYRTFDNNATSLWPGCSEEWQYNVEVVGGIQTTQSSTTIRNLLSLQNFTFISPPIELYACSSANDTCLTCQDELNGKYFDALTLEALNNSTSNGTYLIDCYIPKNLTVVNDTFDCINDECVFISEKYTSGTAGTSPFWTTVASSSGITVTLLYFMFV